jgi:hypothetical protein
MKAKKKANPVFTTIAIENNDYDGLKEISTQFGMKMRTAVGAAVRGWSLLTPEQQAQAIRINVDDGPLGSSAGPEPTNDPLRASLLLNRDAASLNCLVDKMVEDGDIDEKELKTLRPFLRKLIRHIENIDRASSRTGKRGAA